jgi:hypothetical protein
MFAQVAEVLVQLFNSLFVGLDSFTFQAFIELGEREGNF